VGSKTLHKQNPSVLYHGHETMVVVVMSYPLLALYIPLTSFFLFITGFLYFALFIVFYFLKMLPVKAVL